MSGRGAPSGGGRGYGGRSGGRGHQSGRRGGRDGGGRAGGGGGNRGGYDGGRGRGRREECAPPRGLRRLSRGDWETAGEVSLSDDVERRLAVSAPQAKVLEPCRRPGVGKLGLRTVVKANHILVDVAYDSNFHRYDVSIEPVVPKRLNKDIMVALINTYKKSDLGNLTPAYDGSKTLFTTKQFPFSSKDFSVKVGDARRMREFTVTIKWTSEVEFSFLRQFLAGHQLETPQETIQVFDVVLRSAERLKTYTPVGRSLFGPSMGRGPLPGGLEFWKGFYQSLRPTQMGLSLNIDASARAFYEPISVMEYLDSLRYLPRNRGAALSERDRLKVKKALKGITVEVTHRENVKRNKVLGLSTQPCNQLMFSSSDGRKLSVAQYFYQKYNIALEFPALPCLEVGSTKRPTCLPMEVCTIVEGQRYSKKLNEKQVHELLKATAVRPHQRASQVQRMVEQNNYNGDISVRNFGLRVHNNFTLVEARVLPQPTLLYNGAAPGATVDASVGQWNMINQRLHEPGIVRHWACVTFSSEMGVAVTEQFCNNLLDACASKGMNFVRRPLIQTSARRPDMLERALRDVHNECNNALSRLRERGQQLQLLIIILPNYPESYGIIKRVCETELGIVSQCCKSDKAKSQARSYMENLALKINVKVGGRNVVLLDAFNRVIPLVTKDLTMLFGADVTHPQPGEDSTSSIAAVVGSMDWPCFAKYKAVVAAQHHRKEIIGELSSMVRELLLAFRQVNGDLPRRIIFYRDGVSEGEFSNVLLQEMVAIREACQSLEKDYLPPVTFVVVQKRHHTRLFADDPTMTDKSQNILPGTVVDTKICHPSQFDFYLCSHAGIQGTSRPSHYHVLYDENNFTPDLLQLFTYSLCYTYARCTRSVSIVPPAYYAHLAAFRARFYKDRDASEGGSSTGTAGQTSRSAIVEVQQLPDIKNNVQNVMFFC